MLNSVINSCFVLELKLDTCNEDNHYLNWLLESGRHLYNRLLEFAINQIKELEKNKKYKRMLKKYYNDGKQDKELLKAINEIRNSYGLSHFGLITQVYKLREKTCGKYFNTNLAISVADRVWSAVEKVLFSEGKKLHFQKFGEFNSISGKDNKTGLYYDVENNILHCGRSGKRLIKPVIRENDTYIQEALTHRIKFCRIVRKQFHHNYKYFLQLTLEGNPPRKLTLGKGEVGIDIGVSTIAVVSEETAIFEPLANDIDKYNQRIIQLQRKLERSRRLSNPNNYNEDGTIKTQKNGEKLHWKKTKNYKKIIHQLKHLYRLRNCYVTESHNKVANQIVEMGDTHYVELMNYKALQKKVDKPTEQTDKVIELTNKKGETKSVKKCKKKKRFGKSLNNRSPGALLTIINQKLRYYGKKTISVDIYNYKASQYDHIKKEYIKTNLNERVKHIGNNLVQRDLYSAFLLKNYENSTTINQTKCELEFNKFLELQHNVIYNLKQRLINKEILPACMGITLNFEI